MIEFGNITYIYLIPILLGVWYLFFRERLGYVPLNPILIKHLRLPVGYKILWGVRGVLVSSLVLIACDPYMISEEVEDITPRSDILIILDISRSMLSEDISPNRIEGAKDVIHTFLTHSKNQNIGIILFAGKPFLSLPFTTDMRGMIDFLSHVSPSYIRQEKKELSGTAIGDALIYGSTLFGTGGEQKKSIILITDGKANIGIDPYKSIDELQKNNIQVYTVGIGGEIGMDMYYTENGKKTFFYDEAGNTLKNDIDETLLQKLARDTGGIYIRPKNTSELSPFFEKIEEHIIPKTVQQTQSVRTNLDVFCIILSILLVIIERNIKRFLWKKYGFVEK